MLLPPGDAFQFNPVYQHASPASSRLLRRATDTDMGNRSDTADGPDRPRRPSRQSSRDQYSQQRTKKKSLSPPLLNIAATRRSKTTPVPTYPEAEEEEEEAMVFSPDREKFEDYLSRKRRYDLLI